MAFATMNASPPRIFSALKSEKIYGCLTKETDTICRRLVELWWNF